MPLRRALLPALVLTAFGTLPSAASAALSGDLDPAFSGDGAAVVAFPTAGAISVGTHVGAQPDGKVVVAGTEQRLSDGQTHLAVTRLLPDGRRDEGYGKDGRVVLDPGESTSSLDGFVLLPDGSVLVAAEARRPSILRNQVLVHKLTPGGDLDAAWGDDGTAVVGIAGTDLRGGALAVDEAGRVYVGGGWELGNADEDGFIARLTTQGEMDPAYGGGDGFATVPVSASDDDQVRDLAYRDDRLTSAVRVLNGTVYETVVTRHIADPLTPDTTFDGDGQRPFAGAGQSYELDELHLTPGGHVRVGGSRQTGNAAGVPFLAGLDAQGQPDGLGTVVGAAAGKVTGLADGPGGTLYVTGPKAVGGTQLAGELRRLRADGSPDPAFSGDGATTTAGLGQQYAPTSGVAVTPSGDVATAGAIGSATPTLDVDLAGFRFKGADDPAPPVVVPPSSTPAQDASPQQGQAQQQQQDAPPQQQPQTTPPQQAPKALQASDVIVLPKATSCRKGGKLTVRLKLPAGVAASKATVKVGSGKAAKVGTKGLRGAAIAAKLPAGTKRKVTVSVTVAGKVLTRSVTYTACGAKAKRR